MSTPHISANNGDIAKIVLMPGDPLRAKFIADNFLENPVLFNKVRNMFGYTGTYNGKRVSVMGSGMGIPSISLYAHELYSFYDVEEIIRIGSTGAFSADINIYDTILVTKAFSDSSYAYCKFKDPDHFTNFLSIHVLIHKINLPSVVLCRFGLEFFFSLPFSCF